jgi:hypothetical protein
MVFNTRYTDKAFLMKWKMRALTADLAAQMNEGLALDAEIKIQLAKVGFSLEVD